MEHVNVKLVIMISPVLWLALELETALMDPVTVDSMEDVENSVNSQAVQVGEQIVVVMENVMLPQEIVFVTKAGKVRDVKSLIVLTTVTLEVHVTPLWQDQDVQAVKRVGWVNLVMKFAMVSRNLWTVETVFVTVTVPLGNLAM